MAANRRAKDGGMGAKARRAAADVGEALEPVGDAIAGVAEGVKDAATAALRMAGDVVAPVAGAMGLGVGREKPRRRTGAAKAKSSAGASKRAATGKKTPGEKSKRSKSKKA